MSNERSWMYIARRLPEFENGVTEFLNLSFSKAVNGTQIRCPCKRCQNRYWLRRHEVYNHLKGFGFVEKYFVWTFHGEDPLLIESTTETPDEQSNFIDNTTSLLDDRFRGCFEGSANVQNGPNDEAKRFYKLVEEGQQELFPGCKNFSKLSFTIRLFLFKTLHRISNVAFNDLLQLLREMVPEAKIPDNYTKARKIVKDLGLDYKKIYACPNDCMLFWDKTEKDEECSICHASKWKQCDANSSNKTSKNDNSRKIPAKVLWHFPLKPRLQRLYMNSEIAEAMTWHAVKRPNDGYLRHPADGLAWKDFDSLFPSFANEPRNVRLGLASDGFNPFRTMSVCHSTWPVVLVNYNLPPWMFMKPEFLMLSLLIPGPEGPGNNIDVYLQPLIAELKDLWNVGLETYDKYSNETFKLHAALKWTISDFPGNSMLSGWKTKGKFACPTCNHETDSLYLKHSKKMCYMGSRRFLDANDPLRRDKKSFNGKIEERPRPRPLTGFHVLEELSDFVNSFGKKEKKKNDSDCPWKKKSIFFELPYWKHNKCRHNLDMMHIEKNLFDNVLGTLLDISGKSKDHPNARFDLLDMGIKEALQPQLSDDERRVFFPKACYSMSAKEKEIFCRALKGAKFPSGIGSNISRCVNLSQRKVSGYKSHDAHLILHYLLQVAVRRSLPRHVAGPLIRLGNFFRKLCSKVLNQQELDYLESEIIRILCDLEKIFLPSFFDIMVHLPIHLVEEIRLGGPVQGRGMYFIERYLCKLKAYVQNRGRPEGSIAEGYLIEECMNFCARYVEGGRRRSDKSTCEMSATDAEEVTNTPFSRTGHPLGGKKQRNGRVFTLDKKLATQAHRYAIFNTDSQEVQQYIIEHEVFVNSQKRKSKWKRARHHTLDFPIWLKEKTTHTTVSEQIFWLAKGPSPTAKRYKGYSANGYDFYTKSRDARCKTQNSGVTLSALTSSFASSKDRNPVDGDVTYYGSILEIIELNYWSKFTVVLFRCEWYQLEKDEYGMTCVNVNKFCSVDDPFVMPSQVHQVFYVADPVVDGLQYVMSKVPRDIFDRNIENEEPNSCFREPDNDIIIHHGHVELEEDIRLSREDIDPTVVDASTVLGNTNNLLDVNADSDDNDDTLWDWMQADEEDNNEEE